MDNHEEDQGQTERIKIFLGRSIRGQGQRLRSHRPGERGLYIGNEGQL
jgi:hypothetical protein